MKKLFLGTVLLALMIVGSIPAMARVDVNVGISLPPIVFPGPPHLVVIPETNVYVAPDVNDDIYFYGGWWWRPWEGQWYRSRHHDSGWSHYQGTPSFHRSIPSSWRNDYRENRWKGHQWNHQRVPHEQVQKNWQGWEKNKHWEKQDHWGVQDMKNSKTQSQEQGNHERGKEEKRDRN